MVIASKLFAHLQKSILNYPVKRSLNTIMGNSAE